MKAYSCASGGVIFVPDEIERKTNKPQKPASYNEFIEAEAKEKIEKKKGFSLFGKFKKPKTDDKKGESHIAA